MKLSRPYRAIRRSGDFDSAYYLSQLTNPADARDPIAHYLTFGSAHGLRPNRKFDPAAYLAINRDVASSGMEPFHHYVLRGKVEGRLCVDQTTGLNPSDSQRRDASTYLRNNPGFDEQYYLTAGPRINLQNLDPIEHYVTYGSKEGRWPSPGFDPKFYVRYYRDVRRSGIEPFVHYLRSGQGEGRLTTVAQLPAGAQWPAIDTLIEESGLFDENYYRSQAPDLSSSEDALTHYLQRGFRKYFSPSPNFDAIYYTAQNPDFRQSGLPPLSFYLQQRPALGAAPAYIPKRHYHWIESPSSGDDDVHLERIHHETFTARFSLDEADGLSRNIEGAIDDLASRRPGASTGVNNLKASVIIPIYGQIGYTLNCLESLSRHISAHRYNIIVYDDHSMPKSEVELLATIPWIQYVRAEHNGGFLRACNSAATEIKSEFIILLNSDTRVCDGWLDELLRTFTDQPNAGLVGSKLFNEDGSLQEAGAIVWSDGSASHFGRGDDPSKPQYCFARQADYCSGAAIAVPTKLWKSLSGFDPLYTPAYYEDIDLAWRVREAGHEVWYQPLARALHFEGKTHGRDEEQGVKAYQKINAAKFSRRWHHQLTSHGAPGDDPLRQVLRGHCNKVLVLDTRTPTADQDAGSVMSLNLMLIFKRLGWHVSFVPIHDGRYDRKYTADLQRIGIEVFFNSPPNVIDHIAGERNSLYHAILGFRVSVVSPMRKKIRSLFPESLLIFHDIDLHYLRLEREAKLKDDPLLARVAEVTKDEELDLIRKVDCTIVPSHTERALITSQLGDRNVIVHGYTAEVQESPASFSSRRNIAFIGSYAFGPNVDAAHWLAEEIWPMLSTQLPPDAKLFLIGSQAPESIKALARDSVIVTGFLESLAPTLDTCRATVAPLRYGAGLKGKVVSSLSHGLPCVATGVAAEGMGLTDGVNFVLANTAEEIVSGLARVYLDQARWEALQSSGRQFVSEHYSWEQGATDVKQILASAEKVWMERRMRKRKRRLRSQ